MHKGHKKDNGEGEGMKDYEVIICGGNHQSRKWTKKDIIEHTNSPEKIMACIDCCAGVPFKSYKKGYEWRL